MTYCVGMLLDQGIIFMSDTRTNAGVDNISTFRKLFSWSVSGERHMTLLTSGNLATTQALVSILTERINAAQAGEETILTVDNLFRAAELVGKVLRRLIKEGGANNAHQADGAFNATIVLGGQVRGEPPRLFLIYPEGNFIEASGDSPFFQIGETKYGRPILIRGYEAAMSFEHAMTLLLVSFDSTMKANLSVAAPLDYLVYRRDHYAAERVGRISDQDSYFRSLSHNWGEALKQAVNALPDFHFEATGPSP